jgi:CTP synthase
MQYCARSAIFTEKVYKSARAGWSPDGRLKEMMERPDNYFFFATQFHPEFKSRPWDASPPYYGFVKACLDKKLGLPEPVF